MSFTRVVLLGFKVILTKICRRCLIRFAAEIGTIYVCTIKENGGQNNFLILCNNANLFKINGQKAQAKEVKCAKKQMLGPYEPPLVT